MLADNFVKNDVFNVHMQRIDQRFEAQEKLANKTVERMAAIMDKYLAKHDAIAAGIEGDLKAITARLDTQQTKFGWYLTVFGIVLTVVIAAIQFWK